MLSEIRDRATGWIAYVIVGIIIIPFAFWGVNEYFAGGSDVVVATVEGTEIQQAEYRRALDSRRRQMREVMGDNFSPELANSPAFKRRVLDEMISRTLLSQHAEAQGYRIGDDKLAQTIRTDPSFQDGDQFSPDMYASTVSRLGLSRTGYETRLRQQLVLDQIRRGVRSSSFYTSTEQERLTRLLAQERRFDYAVLRADGFIGEQEVSDADLRAEYESRSDRYRTPERMKVEYVELSVDELTDAVDVTEEDLRRAYEQNKERFTTDPVRRASHILFESGSGEEADEEALAKARDLLEQIRSGADFEALAREHSDDPGSASEGGDLGRVESGMMVESFEQALFDLEEEGAITREPVKTRFGYHIIKLTEYQPGNVEPFEAVRDQLLEEERASQAEALFLDRAESFRNISYENPQSLAPVADQLGLTIHETDWFTRQQGDGIAANPEVREAAFGEEVQDEGLNSRAIELDINTLVVVRRSEVQAASLKPLEEVRDDIERVLKQRKAVEHVTELGPELVKELESGAAWQGVTEDRDLEPRQVTWSRGAPGDESAPPQELLNAVFQAPRPAGGGSIPGGVSLRTGDYALFKLDEVVDVEPAEAPEEVRSRVESSLDQRRGQDILEEYIADLRSRAEVEVREGAL